MAEMAKAPTHDHGPRKRGKAPSDEALRRAAGVFRAAGDVARLRLLHHLGGGELCVTELAELTNTKMSTLSQQLRVLFSEHMVDRRRDGKHVYYRLADTHVEELVRAAIDHAEH
jgi:ArsR family transcriptional regulator